MVKRLIKKVQEKTRLGDESEEAVPSNVPNITNTTVAEHRDEVLSTARKYIYPLQHSKHKIVLISTGIFIAMLISFFTYCTLALYRYQSHSTFLYRVTQVIPFPVARIGRQLISYENYLFELKRYIHYYENQQKLDFENNDLDRTQLDEFKKRALERVIDFAYIKRLALIKNVSVSSSEVKDKVDLLREQNRLGSGDQLFEDVLKEYFGWSVRDFERYLYQELLIQKVVATYDDDTQARAEEALKALEGGAKFEDVAKRYSEDVATKNNGGEFGFTIDRGNKDLTPEATEAIFSLEKSKYSGIINTGYTLEIFKLLDKKDDKVEAAHILFNFKDINQRINDLKETDKARAYIHFD